MGTGKSYKIILIVVASLFLVGIGYVYTSIFGNPIVKLTARYPIQRYVKLKYPENYSIGKISYNFKDKSYGTVVMNNNKEKYTNIVYYDDIFSDNKEEEILKDKLNKEIHNLLKEINFKFESLMCSVSVCINANQKLKSMEDLDRYDIAYIKINYENEISKDEFAEMALAIIPKIKANMYYKEGSEIGITYQFEKQSEFHYIQFNVKKPDIKLTKEYIVENTTIKTYK